MRDVQSPARHRRPTIFLAYGASGGDWLRRLAGRLRADPATRWLVERRVVQFWNVGDEPAGEPATAQSVDRLPREVSADRLDGLLDTARGARVAAEVVGLDARQVQVVERVSLFGAPSMADDARVARATMDLLRRDNFDAGSSLTRFEYDWAVLLDATRPAERPADAAIDSARSLLETSVPRSRTFFIDRQDSGAAVVDPDLANEAFLPLAMSLVSSDIGARGIDRPVEDVPRLLWSEPEREHVIPFSVMELVHPPTEVETARARSLLARLMGGVEHAAAARALGDARALVESARRDVAEAGSPTYDPHMARKRRRDAAVALLAWTPVDDSPHDTAALITEVRRTLSALEPWLTPVHSMTGIPATAALPAMIALPSGGPNGWVATAVTVLAAVAVATALVRRRKETVPQAPVVDANEEARRAAARRDVARESQAVVDRLDRLVTAWFAERTAVRQESTSTAAVWQPAPPFAWRLHAAATQADDLLVTPEVCLDVAQRAYARATDGADADEALRSGAREVLRRAARNAAVDEDLAPSHAVLAAALEGSGAQALHRAAASSRLLAHTASALTCDAVVWLSHPALDLGERLRDSVEPALTRRDARVAPLTHDDVTRSVRFAFAQPLRWDDVLSLDCLR